MRLLHITATHLNPEGGVPVVLKNLVQAQNKINNFEARVASLCAETKQINSKYFDDLRGKSFEKYLEEYNPDIAILHSFYYVEYCKISRILNRKGIPYFIEPHGSFGKASMQKSKMKKLIANNTIFRGQIKNAIGFIFLNEAEKQESVYKGKHEIIIPNGIDVKEIKRDIIHKEQCTIYYLGRYDINHKGLDYLLEALKILENRGKRFSLEFWGKGNLKDQHYIQDSLNELKSINVQFNGPIGKKEKDYKLEQLGPMILTSRYEGFPMTVLEAWAYGNPCILTPGTNVAVEAEKNNVGWLTELDSEEIANCIEKALKSYEAHREQYIYNCKKYVQEHYSWEIIAAKSYNNLMHLI